MPPIVWALAAMAVAALALIVLAAVLAKFDPDYLRKELTMLTQEKQDLVAKVAGLAADAKAAKDAEAVAVARADAADAALAQAQADDKEFTDAISGAVAAEEPAAADQPAA